MANSALAKDTGAPTNAEYIVKTDNPTLTNDTALDALPVAAITGADIIMVQVGGLGGELEGATAQSIANLAGGGLLPWNAVAINTTMVADNGYIISGNREMTLPAASAVGAILRLVGDDDIFTLKQAAGQYVGFNTNVTTIGASGSIIAIEVGQTLELVCREANLGWRVISSVGNLFTIV